MNQEDNRHKNVNPFDENIVQQVWEKGKVIDGNSPAIWREDSYGFFMKRQYYGDKSSRYGWDIGYVKPLSGGEGNNINNLQPLQWENKSRKDN